MTNGGRHRRRFSESRSVLSVKSGGHSCEEGKKKAEWRAIDLRGSMYPGIQLFPSLLTESERTGEAGRKERGGVFYENSHGKVKKRPSCACVVMLLWQQTY